MKKAMLQYKVWGDKIYWFKKIQGQRSEQLETWFQWSCVVLIYLGDIVDQLLVLVAGADHSSLFQSAKIPEDLALLLLQRQLPVLQHGLAALQALWSRSILRRPALHQLSML